MVLFPYKKLIVHSYLASDVLTAKLKENVEPYVGFRFDNYSKSSKPYVGKVGEGTFDIRPVFKGQNSFIPHIHGTIEKDWIGSKVTITMRLHFIAIITLLFFLCFIVYSMIKYHEETTGLIFILLIYLMAIVFFNVEFTKTKNTLQRILEARVDLPVN